MAGILDLIESLFFQSTINKRNPLTMQTLVHESTKTSLVNNYETENKKSQPALTLIWTLSFMGHSYLEVVTLPNKLK